MSITAYIVIIVTDTISQQRLLCDLQKTSNFLTWGNCNNKGPLLQLCERPPESAAVTEFCAAVSRAVCT